MTECSVLGCQKPAHSRTYCHMHYRRWRISGDLLSGRPLDWGKRRNHPLYYRWGEVKKKIAPDHPWRDFWKFIHDVGAPEAKDCILLPKDRNVVVGPNNFFWKVPIGSIDKAEYARKWRKANPDKARNNDLKKSFGITLAEYDSLLNKQNGTCAICNNLCAVFKNLAVDHCHTTKKIRGLLCGRCNQGLGCLRDDKTILISAIKYLEENGH